MKWVELYSARQYKPVIKNRSSSCSRRELTLICRLNPTDRLYTMRLLGIYSQWLSCYSTMALIPTHETTEIKHLYMWSDQGRTQSCSACCLIMVLMSTHEIERGKLLCTMHYTRHFMNLGHLLPSWRIQKIFRWCNCSLSITLRLTRLRWILHQKAVVLSWCACLERSNGSRSRPIEGRSDGLERRLGRACEIFF